MHRLIVVTDGGRLTETYGAIKIIEGPNDIYILQYATEQAAREADEKFNNDIIIIFSQPDSIIYSDALIQPSIDILSWGTSRIGADY